MANQFVEDVRVLLDDRSREVLRLLEFSEALVKAKGLAKSNEDGTLILADFDLDRNLVKSIRASGYLLIYNLVEAVMTAALDAIHQQLDLEQRKFEDLNEKIKDICLSNFRVAVKGLNARTALDHTSQILNRCMVSLGYSKRTHWSGNIDAKEIYKKAQRYGFQIVDHNREDSKDGENLVLIRNKRNELGHGELSFVQCGHDTAIENLFDYHKEAVVFLTAVLDGIEEYLENENYLNIDQTSVPQS